MNHNDLESRQATYKKLAKWMWLGTLFGILSLVALFFILSFQDLPSFQELENPKSNLASPVLAANGEVLGRYFVENRVPVSYKELSPFVIQALIATEDERYYEHCGIDPEALLRVAGKTILLRDQSSGGASTITQQLAKMLFTKKPGSGLERVMQKFKEWIIAVRLERKYTKEEIMVMYLNKFNFINGAYGIRAAAEIYFGETPDSLDILESATLVGMLKNPALFNPNRFPDTTKHRRMVVLKQMQKNQLITQAEYDSLRVQPLDMSNFRRETHTDGLAPYFRMELRKELFTILNNEEIRKPDGTKYDIFRDGLKIYTTIDPAIQAHMEAAMLDHMSQLQATFFKRWEGEDPWTYRDEDTTEAEMLARNRTLKRLIQESDRYEKLRGEYLGEIIAKISKEIEGYELQDWDIERMVAENREAGAIKKLVANKTIGSQRAVKYRKVLSSENWMELSNQWRAFQKVVEKQFDTKVKMKVFAYNDDLEKDTVMSPLDSIKYHRMFLQIGSMAVDPLTGHVKGWVGGINHKYFKFDHVRTNRQIGSTFKPFVYATAIDQIGISPCYEVYDIPYTIHRGEGNFNLLEDWTPTNANDRYSGEKFTLKRGLQYSKNTVSVFLMKQLGDAEPVRNLVSRMGISKSRVPRAPSICLGSPDLSVFEMTGAYTTFANNGIYNKPVFIDKIVDNNGRVIFEEEPVEREALHPKPNYVMLEMLKSTISQLGGTKGFEGLKSEIGGKTGTTNSYVDGWFMGITPDLVVGTWVGGEDRWIRFRTLQYGIGAVMARPFFAKVLQRLEKDPDVEYDAAARFVRPPGDLGIVINCNEYQTDGLENLEEGDGFDSGGFTEDIFGDEAILKRDSSKRDTLFEEDPFQ